MNLGVYRIRNQGTQRANAVGFIARNTGPSSSQARSQNNETNTKSSIVAALHLSVNVLLNRNNDFDVSTLQRKKQRKSHEKLNGIDATASKSQNPIRNKEIGDGQTSPLQALTGAAFWLSRAYVRRSALCCRRAIGLRILSCMLSEVNKCNAPYKQKQAAVEWVVNEVRTTFAFLRAQDKKIRSFVKGSILALQGLQASNMSGMKSIWC